MKSKYLKGRILKAAASILLCLMMIYGTFMPMSQVSYAADGDDVIKNVTLGPSGSAKVKSINVGANAVKINAEGWKKSNGQYIYYGTYDGRPIKFRVLDMHNGNSNTIFNDGASTMQTEYEGNYLLLDCDSALFKAIFSASQTKDYFQSEIRQYLSAGKDNNNNPLFSGLEMEAVANTILNASSESYSVGLDQGISVQLLEDYSSGNDKTFLLNGAEAVQAYNGYEARTKGSTCWTRSADARDNYQRVCVVEGDGAFKLTYTDINGISVSPAFNLDLGSVIFTSIDGAPKDGALTKVDRSDEREFKVTLKDTGKTITPNNVTRNGQEVKVLYTYTGDDVDQVSIVLTSGDITASDTTVLYYGKLAEATSSKSGEAIFNLPEELPAGYKAYILAEDINADKNTDYASEPVEIAIPEPGPESPVTHEEFYVTFKSNGGPSVPKQTVKKGEKVTEPDLEEMTKEGYVFNGWFIDKKCKNRYSFDSPVNDDMTLYAGWVAEDEVSTIKDYKNTSDLSDDDKKRFI